MSRQQIKCKYCGKAKPSFRHRYCSEECRFERCKIRRIGFGLSACVALAVLEERDEWVMSDSHPFDALVMLKRPLAQARLFRSYTGRWILFHRITAHGRVILRYWRFRGVLEGVVV